MSTQYAPPSLTDIESAIYCVSPNINRDEWAKVGMALSSELGEAGFPLFDSWSSQGDSYKVADTKATWRSVSRGSGIRINTLFFLARQNGYTGTTAGQITQQEAAERKQIRQQQEEQKRLRERYKGERNRKALRKVWSGCTPLNYCDDTPAHRYLLNRMKGYPLPDITDDLLFHPELEYWSDGIVTRHPALVAVVRDAKGDPVTMHRTYITEDGQKANVTAPKKLMPPPYGMTVTGCSIQLGGTFQKMVIAEGIESALAASLIYDRPAIATISAHGMKRWEPIRKVFADLIIAADNDESGTGLKAALTLKTRMKVHGIPTTIKKPADIGFDHCDCLLEPKE